MKPDLTPSLGNVTFFGKSRISLFLGIATLDIHPQEPLPCIYVLMVTCVSEMGNGYGKTLCRNPFSLVNAKDKDNF